MDIPNMTHHISEKEEGKTVVDHDGEILGIVSEVDRGTAYITPDPGITDRIKVKLGWGEREQESFPLQGELVETITENEIRLRPPESEEVTELTEEVTHPTDPSQMDPERPSAVETHSVGVESDEMEDPTETTNANRPEDPDANAGPVEEMRRTPPEEEEKIGEEDEV